MRWRPLQRPLKSCPDEVGERRIENSYYYSATKLITAFHMKRIFMIAFLLSAGIFAARAQDTTGNRALSLAEYEKVKTFAIGDLDKDTYVKFENAYILDHHDF